MFSGLRENSLERREGNFQMRSREGLAWSREQRPQLCKLGKPATAMSTSTLRPSDSKQRVLDIERALSWAYREELPKRQRRLALENAVDAPRMQPSPLAWMMALATPIDSWSRHPGFQAALEDAHSDALAIQSAVHRLGKAGLVPDPAEYASELAGLVLDSGQYGRVAVGRLAELVMTSAK